MIVLSKFFRRGIKWLAARESTARSCCRLLRFAAVLGWTISPRLATAQVDPSRAAKVKAAYVLNFIKFTEWPADVFKDQGSPIDVCFLGESETEAVLKTMVRDAVVGGREIHVRRVVHAGDAEHRRGTSRREDDRFRGCHVLYLDQSMEAQVASILEQIKGQDVLTISDMPDFVEHGGMLGLALRGDRIQFDANLKAIQRTRIKISSKVLKLAKVVEP
jgi:hypothetical protein